jgi:hypothetical protein
MAAVHALRKIKIGKTRALAQLAERPDLAGNISAAARLFGRSRATIRSWLAERAAMAAQSPPPPPAMAEPVETPSPVEAATAALSALCDALENITPAEVVEASSPVELIGIADDATLAAGWLTAVEVLARSVMRRAGR